MGSWDCYCAICGSALCGATISERPRTARFHRRRAAERRRAAAANESAEGQDGYVSEESDEDNDDNESIESYDEENSYDPAILSSEDIEWTRSAHILGFNPDANNVTKAFIVGPGSYWDYGGFNLEHGGMDDPNQPAEDNFTCYYTHESGELPVFPFHWCCFELLLKALTNTTDLDRLDKELLYNIMHELAPDYTHSLDLDYGNPGPYHDQFWQSMPGQEFVVVKPVSVPQLVGILRDAIGEETFKNSPQTETPANLEARIANDPFANMPYDILYKILRLLPFDSISKLSIGSWPVHASLRDNGGFWKQLLRNSMPWFFELHDLLEDEKLVEDRDYHKLFMWLEKITRPKLWMEGPFMAVANRRRIWGVCEQLAGLYHNRLSKRANADESDEMAKLIWKHAENPQMPLVVHPLPTANVETSSTQWVRSWDELDSGIALFNAFWSDDGSLTGLSMSLSGRHQRLFGQEHDVEDVPRHTATIESLSEFRGLILHLKDMIIGERDAETFIVGITVVCDFAQYTFGDTDEEYLQRPLLISEGKYLVGVVGQTAGGKVCRLGLLQCPRPPHDDFDFLRSTSSRPDIPYQQRHLWKHSLRGNLGTCNNSTISVNIWDHPSLCVISAPDTNHSNSSVPKDVLPYEAHLWAKDAEELRNIKRLSGYVAVGGTISGTEGDGKWFTRDYHDICGARVEYVPDCRQPSRFVGHGKEVWDDDMVGDWEEENMVHFDIDGPGGEVVTRVEVAMHQAPKALKLFTNRGRETYWGEQKVGNWQTLQAPQGQTIVGLVLAFGQLSGWDHETRTNKHKKMSSVGIMTLPLGVE